MKRDLYYSDTVTAFTYITFLIFVELVSWQCIISDFEVRVVIWHLYSHNGTCNGIEYDDMILYDMVLTFESVDELLRCYHSNKSYWAVLSWGTVYYAVQGGSNVWVCGWNPMVLPFKWKLLSSTFLWCCLLCCLTILYVNEIQWCDHSNETYSLVFSHGAVCFRHFPEWDFDLLWWY